MSFIGSLIFLATASPTACIAIDAMLQTPFTDWKKAPTAKGPVLPIGAARTLVLSKAASEKPDTYGINTNLNIKTAGQYSVALSRAAWIDVIAPSGPLTSSTHRHGPECTSIRKIVTFQLKPGNYQLRIKNSPVSSATIKILREF